MRPNLTYTPGETSLCNILRPWWSYNLSFKQRNSWGKGGAINNYTGVNQNSHPTSREIGGNNKEAQAPGFYLKAESWQRTRKNVIPPL